MLSPQARRAVVFIAGITAIVLTINTLTQEELFDLDVSLPRSSQREPDVYTPNVEEAAEAIRNTLEPPSHQGYVLDSTKQWNTIEGNRYWSRYEEDVIVDTLLGGMTNGFFLEARAFDGQTHSNTLFLEKERGWNGLLLEATGHDFSKLLKTNRRCYKLKAGLSDSNFVRMVSPSHAGKVILPGDQAGLRSYYPLGLLMDTLNKSTIHYLSLQNNGVADNAKILATIDFSKLKIGVVTVEHDHAREHSHDEEALLQNIKSAQHILRINGFVRPPHVQLDHVFFHPQYVSEINPDVMEELEVANAQHMRNSKRHILLYASFFMAVVTIVLGCDKKRL